MKPTNPDNPEPVKGRGRARQTIEAKFPKVTLHAVARAAGVAVGTASRVLNHAANVDPVVQLRVQDAIAQLGYARLRKRVKPRAVAGRATGRSLGLVLLGMDDSLVHVPVLTEVLHGIENAVSLLHGNLLLANLPQADQIPAFIANNQVEGLIIKVSQYSPLPDPAQYPLIKALLRFPRVWIWAKPENSAGDLCSFNHESAALLVAAYLQARGHRRVAFINPKQGKASLEHMKKEFTAACARHGLELTTLETQSPGMKAWPEPALASALDVSPLVDRWLAIKKDRRPTAAFVPADNIAMFVYRALENRGVRIERDLSVISCNSEKSVISVLKPALTTVEVHAREIGQRAVDQLVWRIEHPDSRVDQSILLEPVLTVGESVALITRH